MLRAARSVISSYIRRVARVTGFQWKAELNAFRYWEERYRSGGNSGPGSYQHLAEFKAEVLNRFVADNAVADIIEFGCGDGNQLEYAQYPRYLGLDVSNTAIELCRDRYASDSSKKFLNIKSYTGEKAQLALSLDVVFHLVNDDVFEQYMERLFGAGKQFVIIYSSNKDDQEYIKGSHVRHRNFTRWIEEKQPAWELFQVIENRYPFKGNIQSGSFSDFFVYRKVMSQE